MKPLFKTLGPLNRAKYRWGDYYFESDDSVVQLYSEITQSTVDLGFKTLNGPTAILADGSLVRNLYVEAQDDAMDAQFMLTWSDYIDTSDYVREKIRARPVDWIRIAAYHITHLPSRHSYIAGTLILLLLVGPAVLEHYLHFVGGYVQLIGLGILWIAIFITMYDNYRERKHLDRLFLELDT